MKYKLPTGGEKRRICRLMFARLVELARQAKHARERGKYWKPRILRVVYNPYSGRFRLVPLTCEKRKNEIWVVYDFPHSGTIEDLRDGNTYKLFGYGKDGVLYDLAIDFLGAVRAENFRGSHWPTNWLAAERLLEIANERRTDYDD